MCLCVGAMNKRWKTLNDYGPSKNVELSKTMRLGNLGLVLQT